MTSWGAINRVAYTAASWWHDRRTAPVPPATAQTTTEPAAGGGDAILLVAWGRIGDAILGNAAVRLLRERTGRSVHVAGRPETEPIVAPCADGFLPLPALGDTRAAERFAATAPRRWFAVIGDLHVFHGGNRRLGAWLASLQADHRLVYAGYAPRLVSGRRTPPGYEVVAARGEHEAMAEAQVMAERHVLHDLAHYLSVVLRRLGAGDAAVAVSDLAPQLGAVAVPGSAVVCQPFSNNRKKDWPVDRWRQLFASFPEQRFVLLGGAKDLAAAAALVAANVESLCGSTTLAAALARIAGAPAFLGVDSGLAHAAAALRVPTVVVSHCSNLGYFFPYPQELGFEHVQIAYDARFVACSGCLSVCTREPIWRTYRAGALCLRELAVDVVRGELTRALARAVTCA
jgi:hypothetical protein